MITILSMLIMGIFCLLCFQYGYKAGKKEELITNPITKIEEIKENRKEKEENNKLNNILLNLENYDGTGSNQKEIE